MCQEAAVKTAGLVWAHPGEDALRDKPAESLNWSSLTSQGDLQRGLPWGPLKLYVKFSTCTHTSFWGKESQLSPHSQRDIPAQSTEFLYISNQKLNYRWQSKTIRKENTVPNALCYGVLICKYYPESEEAFYSKAFKKKCGCGETGCYCYCLIPTISLLLTYSGFFFPNPLRYTPPSLPLQALSQSLMAWLSGQCARLAGPVSIPPVVCQPGPTISDFLLSYKESLNT